MVVCIGWEKGKFVSYFFCLAIAFSECVLIIYISKQVGFPKDL